MPRKPPRNSSHIKRIPEEDLSFSGFLLIVPLDFFWFFMYSNIRWTGKGIIRMILYHGSNVEVREPRLLKIQRDLDFGKGFYTTSDLDQAAKWAKRTSLRLRQGKAFVSVYEINEVEIEALRVLRFDSPDAQWLRFVVKNRTGYAPREDWDLVIGPVANDQTAPVIDLFLDGRYDEAETIKRLLPQKLKDQYTFKTEKGIALLRCTEVISV